MRVIKTIKRAASPDHSGWKGREAKAVVYFHADWQEYFVRFWADGTMLKRIYQADDKEDAIATADWYVNGKY